MAKRETRQSVMCGIKSCWDPLRWDEGLGDGVEDVAIVDEVVVGTGCCCC